MNFLQLVNRLRQESGCSGADLTDTVGQTGEALRYVNFINNAYLSIQEAKSDWLWMRQPVSFNSVNQQQSYTPTNAGISATLANYKLDSFRIYSQSLGVSNEMILPWMDYDRFRNFWNYGVMRTTYQRPVMFTVDPQKNFLLGATPNDIYVVNGEYFTLPVTLVAATDTPLLISQFHMLIVYEAMKHSGMYEAAPEVVARGKDEAQKMMLRLTKDQLPGLEFGEPLA